MADCADCSRPYGEDGFEDLVVPNHVWRRISPTGDEGGLLCPSCLCVRLTRARITCAGAFMSGPIQSVSRDTMQMMRQIENLQEQGMEAIYSGKERRMSDAMQPVPDDDPLMIAWKAYQETEAFANTRRWAEHVTHEHLQGSLWTVFMAGFHAGVKSTQEGAEEPTPPRRIGPPVPPAAKG